MPEIRIPGPDHPITIAAHPRRVRALFEGHLIAETDKALRLEEAGYPARFYFPREDVSMEYLARTDKTTYCPYKGEAHYFTIDRDGRIAENAVWTYEAPYPAVAAIEGALSFYPDQVDVYGVGPAAPADGVRESILHTDDGAGQLGE